MLNINSIQLDDHLKSNGMFSSAVRFTVSHSRKENLTVGGSSEDQTLTRAVVVFSCAILLQGIWIVDA